MAAAPPPEKQVIAVDNCSSDRSTGRSTAAWATAPTARRQSILEGGWAIFYKSCATHARSPRGGVGQEDALERLFRHSGFALRKLAERWIARCGIGDWVTPDDILGWAFVALLRDPQRMGRIQPERRLPYVSRMVKHRVITILRSKKAERRALVARTAGSYRTQRDMGMPHNEASAEWNEQLAIAYDTLTAEERTICTYRRAGYGWDQIAALMNRTPACVQKRYQRAFTRVRESLQR